MSDYILFSVAQLPRPMNQTPVSAISIGRGTLNQRDANNSGLNNANLDLRRPGGGGDSLANPGIVNQLTGPSPAFQTSLLELETNIEFVIKQIHADREKERNGTAAMPIGSTAMDSTNGADSDRVSRSI